VSIWKWGRGPHDGPLTTEKKKDSWDVGERTGIERETSKKKQIFLK